jgi:excisionase family DNA binding protein
MRSKKTTTTPSSPLDDLQTINSTTVAKLLNVSLPTVNQLYYSNELPGIVIGERLRFPVSSVRKYIEDNLRKKPTIIKTRRATKGHSRDPKPSTVA